MYQGKGAPSTGTSGSWNSWKGSPKFGSTGGGKNGKGKGKGKGKPSNVQVALARAAKVPGATPICDEYRRTGQCTFKARTGKRCEFLHVDKIPAQLSSIEGLISSDFAGVDMKCDFSSGVWTCGMCTEQSAAAIANLESEVQNVYEELLADYQCGEEAPAQPFH